MQEHLDEVDKLHRSLGRGDKGVSRTLREKDKELRDIQCNRTLWKDQTTEKMTKKCQNEVHRELERCRELYAAAGTRFLAAHCLSKFLHKFGDNPNAVEGRLLLGILRMDFA